MKYQDYLNSDDWKGKRLQKLGRKSGSRKRCAICGETSKLDVHHLSYERDLTMVKQCDLRILCRRCHDIAHQLINSGDIKFRSKNHHSRFAITKEKVKAFLGISGKNMFNHVG